MSIEQLIERARILREIVPRDLPRDYDALAAMCARELNRCIEELDSLLDFPFRDSPCRPEGLRQYRRLVGELDLIEKVAIAALERSNKHDHRLNRLVERIKREINYPLGAPVVSSLSQQYFSSSPYFNILSVPLTEGRFLLHLPDLYHELCHFILDELNDPVVEPLREAVSHVICVAHEHCSKELKKLERQRGTERVQTAVRSWMYAWGEAWAVEFTCDLFAIYTLGPAFAWSHFHLVAKRVADPFKIPENEAPSSHPCDDARMRVMLEGLRRTSYGAEARQIEVAWDGLLEQLGAKASSEYELCFPESLFEVIAGLALDGVRRIGCRLAGEASEGKVRGTLNRAWKEFWERPEHYVAWEKSEVDILYDDV